MSNIIEDELGIPLEAYIPSSSSSSAIALLQTTQGASIPLTMETCVRKKQQQQQHVRGLIVGRQASTSDIRIQHGSISRRHAIFYYLPSAASGSFELILQDLKGKHGISCNGERISSGTTQVLKPKDSIIFGNVRETRFCVQFSTSNNANAKDADTAKNTNDASTKNSTPSDARNTTTTPATTTTTNTDTTTTTSSSSKQKNEKYNNNDSSSTRAQREAEIRAMTESLDEIPAYTKYNTTTSSSDDPIISNNNTSSSSTTTTAARNISNDNIPNNTNNQLTQAIQTHQLPIQEIFPISLDSTNDDHHFSNNNKKSKQQKDIIITCIAIDPAGSRFICGSNRSNDESIRMFDFGGMDRLRTNPFKTIVVEEGHKINDISYSNTGDRYIVGTGSAQPKILDRDGYELIQFVRGDMYVTDQKHTMGHTATVSSVDWHPFERNVVLTASYDGSARLWDLEHGKKQFQMLCCQKVFSIKNKSGRTTDLQTKQKVRINCVTFHPNGYEFALGTNCGSIQIWNIQKNIRPEKVKFDAIHVLPSKNQKSIIIRPTHPVNSLVYNPDGTKLASRSCQFSSDDDDGYSANNNNNNNIMIPCCNLWDTKRLSNSSKPIAICQNVPSVYDRSNSSFNPNGTILCIGTSQYTTTTTTTDNDKQQQKVVTGRIKFFHVATTSTSGELLDPIADIEIPAGVIIVEWHAKLNQIFLGCSDGRILILFDPPTTSKSSKKKVGGAILPYMKAGKQVDGLSQLLQSRAPTGSVSLVATGNHNIITPFALPMFQDANAKGIVGHHKKRKKDDSNDDAIKSHKPEPPAKGIKTGGQGSAVNTFTQFVVDSTMKAAAGGNNNNNKTIAGAKDPREELFKYREGKSYINQAYVGNKEVVLAEKTVEQEEEEMRRKKK